jgi:hypothetical protein
MKLIENWRDIAKRAWSMRLMVLAALLSGVEIVLPLFSEALPRGLFAVLSFLAVAGAFVARLIAQKGLSE